MKRIGFLFLLFSLFLITTVYSKTLELKSWQIWDFSYNGIHGVCCAVSVKNGEIPVTGLSFEDFTITETLVDEYGNVLSKAEIAPEQREDQFGGIGFWERSVSSSKIDLVFLIDKTGSMADQIESIKSELKEFVNRLEADACDFRVAVLLFEAALLEEPGRKPPDHPFYGAMEMDELLLAIEEIETAGEWHINTWSYDAILFSSQLEFREDSRAVLVVITDTLPETVHGPFWYFSGGSVATKRAVEIALEERGIELEYFQPEESELAHMENYNRLINPALSESNFDHLAGAVSLGWPFKQDLIKVDALPVSESIYYLSWNSGLDEITDYYRKEGFKVEVDVKCGDEHVSLSYSPFFDEEGYLQSSEDYHLPVLDEEGNQLPDKAVEMGLLRELGDLKAFSGNYATKDGVLQLRSVDPGDYLYRLYAYGRSSYSYSTLRLKGTGKISFVQGEVIPDFVVARTGDAFLESVKIRGLMDEFVSNKIAVNESKEFAEKSLKWIDAVASDGLNLREMEALKRVYVSVGAFLNGMAYAAIESERVESDLLQMVRDTRSMTRKAGHRLQGMGSREENRQSIQVSMQLRKLSRHDFLKLPHFVIPNSFRDPGLILSEDGGPLTDNVAFSSDQRVFVLKRAAALRRGC
ncbi:von Willebrand factor type A-like protein [Mesotoga prima MesG1.Ag.4.2]|uniref:von Willebrand factor type A-like protein n=1 Tax=Mesotoga prima MesG1.Ag.4.2 TaxID=660470 RepID=I2F3W9_9BACT|nr:vWA domain-containing protein [Mesotoga prima]AFK06622.1 von Willebrand factor type A-like protein [Mesotoga prima MesG1.Ag.4.2]HNS76746.1 VWA domain-containing protein [Mesotoga prima]